MELLSAVKKSTKPSMTYTISWARFKALKAANASATIFYVPTVVAASALSTANNYLILLGGANNQFTCDVNSPSDVSDFQTNFKAAATAVATLNDAISFLVTL